MSNNNELCIYCKGKLNIPPTDSNWEEEIKEILAHYNGEILNKFQDEYLMQKGTGCEEILFPVLEKAIKDFITPPNDGIIRKFNLKSRIQSLIQSEREEQKAKMVEEIKKRDSKMYGYYKSVFEDGFEGGYPAEWDDFINKQ